MTITVQNIAYLLSKYDYQYQTIKNNADETIVCSLKSNVYPNTTNAVQIEFQCPDRILSEICDYGLSDYAQNVLDKTPSMIIKTANAFLASCAYDNNLSYQDFNDDKIGRLLYTQPVAQDMELLNILNFYHDFYHDLAKQLNKPKYFK